MCVCLFSQRKSNIYRAISRVMWHFPEFGEICVFVTATCGMIVCQRPYNQQVDRSFINESKSNVKTWRWIQITCLYYYLFFIIAYHYCPIYAIVFIHSCVWFIKSKIAIEMLMFYWKFHFHNAIHFTLGISLIMLNTIS